VVGGLWVGLALGAESQQAATKLETKVKAERPYKAAIIAETYMGFRDENRPLTQFYIDGHYKFDDANRIRAVIPAKKRYNIASVGEDEFSFDDVFLYYYRVLSQDFNKFKVEGRAGLTLPISPTSRRNDIISKPSLMVSFSRKFLNDKLSLSYRPYVSHYMNTYTHTVGPGGGTPLPKFSLGHWLVGEYRPVKEVSLGTQLHGAFLIDHANGNAEGNPNNGSRWRGTYDFEFYAGYDFTESVGGRIGFLQSDKFTQNGRYEVNIYDAGTSMVSFALDITL